MGAADRARGRGTLRAGDDAAALRRDVHAGHGLVVALELILERELGAAPLVELDVVVARDDQRLPVGREGVVGDRVVEEKVDFRSGHDRKALR